jgi:pimeloyl-ACP methyl ester carboxylesterase
MSTPYTVRPGDTLSSIARAHGLHSWQELYQHSDNAGFRAMRPNPNQIYPGDVLQVPDRVNGAAISQKPNWVLAAIDGTDSKTWRWSTGLNSHVFKFHRDFRTPDPKHQTNYADGPNTSGFNVSSIVKEICGFLNKALADFSPAHVALVGHSRGGLIAVLAARELGTPIEFMGLYDAVDRHIGPSGAVIPKNVKVVYHAMRDPSVQSRVYFGNTATQAEAGVKYVSRHFKATHGGIGGDPHGGENEVHDNLAVAAAATAVGGLTTGISTYQSLRCTISLEIDQRGAREADRWMREGARSHGLPI